ncbi:hypothetical protein VV02_03265 [Luteipulveratus mongoliensis]|uniref:Aminoglycoside phosphotransferase domain-containing protein n=1 Tax=Luteipulveratus mongoliensis TaxID=571913 RepID=A0A0K1JEI0_9MICO|nr:hypothetical protein VV02_03265 [Luteipulveratus mongoliensis]
MIRFARDPKREDEFATEVWCLAQAAQCGVPSPEVVAYDQIDGASYLVHRFVPGASGDTRPTAALWRDLGRYARAVRGVSLHDAPAGLFGRFGRDPEAAWRAHLDYNDGQLREGDPLIWLGVYRAEQRQHVRDLIGELRSASFEFGLCHGDLAPRNLLVRPESESVLIDWGCATVAPVPHHDFVYLLDGTADDDGPPTADVDAFADGYGVRVADLMPTLEPMRVLAAIDVVRWAIDRRPDRVDELVSAARRRLSPLLGPT